MDVLIEVTEATVSVSAPEGTRALLSTPGMSAVFPRVSFRLPVRELVLVGGASARAPTGV